MNYRMAFGLRHHQGDDRCGCLRETLAALHFAATHRQYRTAVPQAVDEIEALIERCMAAHQWAWDVESIRSDMAELLIGLELP